MGMPRGEILTLEQVWALARLWYTDRMNPDFRGRTHAEAQDIFRRLGLDAPFWQAGMDTPEDGDSSRDGAHE
jgi:hypothetical protein